MSYEDGGMPAGGNGRFRGYPARMSERQQLALLLQMTSQEASSGSSNRSDAPLGNARSSPLHHKSSKSRWSNKNTDVLDVSTTYSRQDDRLRVANGCDNKKRNEFAGSDSPEGVRQATGAESPVVAGSPTECAAEQQHQQQQQHHHPGASSTAAQHAEDAGEMRRTPPQNKGSAGAASVTASSAVASSTSGPGAAGSGVVGSTSACPGAGSAEALAASGAGATPADEPMMTTTSPPSSGSAATSVSVKRAFDADGPQGDDPDEEGRKRKKKDPEPGKETGPAAKGTAGGRQTAGRNNPGVADKCAKSGKQAAGAMLAKSGQSSGSVSAERKSPSSTLSANSPKPTSASTASNPGGNPKGGVGGAPASTESDGEDERSKSSDCNSAPKVPPLKIVIPQSTTSEQEQGNRNGKNTSNRGHQLPYVVASSNSNDSMDKEQQSATVSSGTTSPLEAAAGTTTAASSKAEEKKDFSGALDAESRSTHHQRVLRSSHRSGNGANGAGSSTRGGGGGGGGGGAAAADSTPAAASGNGSYSNSSPLPASAADRSNNSSPQQRHHSPGPEAGGTSEPSGKSVGAGEAGLQGSPAVKATAGASGASDKCDKADNVKKEATSDGSETAKKESAAETTSAAAQPAVELHPRKRKLKTSKEAQQATSTAAANEPPETTSTGPEVHPHDQPITNCYQLFLNIRKQIERRRKGLFPVQPKPPQGFKDYLMNRCTYVLAGNANKEPNINPPVNLLTPMKDLYIDQEKERYRLRMQHVVEKEKLVLSVEQEILRVHGRAARALANQSLPFSVCTILKDEEVYNVITPEQEEKDRNARSRYNGRLFLSWLQDVDDKWEKIKEAMLLRHHNEAESLHAVQRMDWEWKLKEVGLCEFKATPQIEDLHVPMVHVSDDFDLLPA